MRKLRKVDKGTSSHPTYLKFPPCFLVSFMFLLIIIYTLLLTLFPLSEYLEHSLHVYTVALLFCILPASTTNISV